MSEEDIENLLPTFHGTTLEEAKTFVQLNLTNGTVCPCCAQFAKVYKRKLYSTIAVALCLIYQHFQKNPGHTWLHVQAFLIEAKRDSSIMGGDVVKLRYWGLIERAAGERDDGSDRIGRYRITELGKQFVEGKVAVPGYVFLYNGHVLRMSEEMTTIQEALGAKFNYSELMRG